MELTKQISGLVIVLLCVLLPMTSALESRSKREVELSDPTHTIRALEELLSELKSQTMEKSKRDFDMGFQRGYAGNQLAKHLLGLNAASYASGPGKR